MEIVRRLVAPCTPARLFAHVDDLSRYPAWMDLVHAVERESADDAWDVELRATVGPFARSKRLRMERTELVPDRVAVFERAESDGRNHSPWMLRAELAPIEPSPNGAAQTELTMTLRYGGNLWTGAVLQRVLDDKVAAGSAALLALVTAESRPS
ncbi:SRPBCC family protein [Ilumatobacter coccineus]|uniref:Coenzyme Q-binding protein COQ10 START domain-containing protein n=1 Tax=Ilumatobacter coccineus (strain NBRC 103263 / KCTC 29153 / YM16-304) TaxID=1313172 RepID=A0A6C7E874_ILUCY|nr:SRPBCC family protein [Ilumatobacter coccineus]BAN02563.1 hypothetical protein YM304_22490 [Ilumatobacter coccineus YM16-304]